MIVHVPAPQPGVPFTVEHTLPQPAAAPCPLLVAPPGPQFITSNVDTSQPSDCLFVLQSAKPFAQVPLQTPAPHVRVDM